MRATYALRLKIVLLCRQQRVRPNIIDAMRGWADAGRPGRLFLYLLLCVHNLSRDRNVFVVIVCVDLGGWMVGPSHVRKDVVVLCCL